MLLNKASVQPRQLLSDIELSDWAIDEKLGIDKEEQESKEEELHKDEGGQQEESVADKETEGDAVDLNFITPTQPTDNHTSPQSSSQPQPMTSLATSQESVQASRPTEQPITSIPPSQQSEMPPPLRPPLKKPENVFITASETLGLSNEPAHWVPLELRYRVQQQFDEM